MFKLVTLGIGACLVASCASTGPYAQIDGESLQRAPLDEANVIIVGTDRQLDPAGSTRVTVAPGFHTFLIATTRRDRQGRNSTLTLPMVLKPCMRYTVVARHPNAMDTLTWEPVITAVEPIPECVAAASAAASAPK